MNENQNQIEERADAIEYIGAGHAVFTVVSKVTGTRFTYQARRSQNGNIMFLDVLTGPDNENDFTFAGTLAPAPRLTWKHSAKSTMPSDAPSIKALAWFITRGLHDNRCFGQTIVYHAGRCSKCRRTLTDPESLRTGMGPVCRGRA